MDAAAHPGSPPSLSVGKQVLRIAGLAWLIGFVAALLECLAVQLFSGLYPNSALDILEILLLYSTCSLLGGLVFGLLVCRAARRRPLCSQPALAPAVLVSLFLFVILGDWINEVWLTGIEFYRPSGLAATAALAGVAILVGLACYRLGKEQRGRRAGFRLLLGLGLSLPVAIGIVCGLHPQRHPDIGHKPKLASPNVFLITIDTLRADHLSCYGYDRPTTPALDALAHRGVMFRRHHAQSSWTRPSTATILSGLYPSVHGANQINEKLGDGVVTLAELAAQQGYRTAAFSANAVVSPLFGFDQGFDYFWSGEQFPFIQMTALYRILSKFGLSRFRFRFEEEQVSPDAHQLNQAALPWIEQNRDGSLFVYLHYMDPHSPYGPPEYLLPGPAPAKSRLYPPQDYPGSIFPFAKAPDLEPREKQELLNLYDGAIRFCDREIGRLLERLEEMDLTQDAVVIVTADHGEEFFEHFGWEHGKSLYEEVLSVPLILYGPSRLPTGRVVDAVTSSVDIFPTVCQLLGTEVPYDVPGKRLTPGEPPPAAEEVFSEVMRSGFEVYSLLSAPYKIIDIRHGPRKAVQLFDLETDPQEQDNLSPRDSVRSAELLSALQKEIAASHRPGVAAEQVPMDTKTIEKLKALGYVN
jgi:arylsulfatase A-like enzyme